MKFIIRKAFSWYSSMSIVLQNEHRVSLVKYYLNWTKFTDLFYSSSNSALQLYLKIMGLWGSFTWYRPKILEIILSENIFSMSMSTFLSSWTSGKSILNHLTELSGSPTLYFIRSTFRFFSVVPDGFFWHIFWFMCSLYLRLICPWIHLLCSSFWLLYFSLLDFITNYVL